MKSRIYVLHDHELSFLIALIYVCRTHGLSKTLQAEYFEYRDFATFIRGIFINVFKVIPC